jgi:AraC-like DNA-binding protein
MLGPDRSQPCLARLSGRHRERAPCPVLRPHVDRIWIFEVAQACELELVPDGCIDIYWNGRQLMVAGPSTELLTVRTTGRQTFVGARFAPGVAYRWLGVSARELLNTHASLDDTWGMRADTEAIDSLTATRDPAVVAWTLERMLASRLASVPPADPIIEATLGAAREHPRGQDIVREVVDGFGWSERTLRRRCDEAFGYGPKTLDRILRFQRFLALAWTQRSVISHLAAAAGYADQSHLVREVRRLAGQSPSRLLAEVQT